MTRVLRLLLPAATLAYPLLVYFGSGRLGPLWIALALASVLFMKAWIGRHAGWLGLAVAVVLLGALAQFWDSLVPLKLYPVAVSAALLGMFAHSAWKPPTVIERIARLSEPQLPPEGVAYTRKVTLAWCGFFIVNGSLSALTALWASERTWVLYNGLVAYLLMGTFFLVELLLRRRARARMGRIA